jgi:hypothetical protein
MTTSTSAVKTKAPLSPLRIVASVLFLLFGILSTISATSMSDRHLENFQFLSGVLEWSSEGGLYLFELFLLVSSIAAPVLALLTALIGLLSRSRWLQTILGGGLFAFVFLASWMWQLIITQSEGLFIWIGTWSFRWTQNQDGFNYADSWLGWAALLFILLALVVSTIASATSSQRIRPSSQVLLEGTSTATQSAQAQASVSTSQSNLTNLPMFALIGAFIIPLAGIILGHLSLSYMKKGQLSTQNKGMATTGLILGYVFVGLGFLTGLILVIALIVSAASGF